jgi:uncharacterized membrane protein YqjE
VTATHGDDAGLHTDRGDHLDDASLGELISDLGSELGTLIRKEMELARIEAKHEAGKLGRAAALFGGTAVAALLALIVLSAALALWIAEGWNIAVAFGLVGAVWTIAAAVMYSVARSTLARVRPMPETTEALRTAVQGQEHAGTSTAASSATNTSTATHTTASR